MKIGEAASVLKIPPSTLRFYERKGLLGSRVPGRRANNYREYSEVELDRLKLLLVLKDAGFPLDEASRLLGEDQQGECGSLVESARRQAEALDRTIRELGSRRDRLRSLLEGCRSSCETSDTLDCLSEGGAT